MSYDGSVHRRQRGTGKCLLSRMVNLMEGLLSASPSAIKSATLDSCQENVTKAHRVFQEYHDLIVENDVTLTDEQNEAELKLHDEGLLRYREAYQDVKNRAEAWLRAKKLKASLEALENHLAGRYRPDKAAVYVTIETAIEELRELYAPDDISEHAELRRIGDEVEEVWARVVALRADAGFSTESVTPGTSVGSGARVAPEERRSRSHLKVPPPTFSGQLSEFTDFRTLFMSVVDVEDVSEPAKKALMINAMTTPDTKSNALSACKEVDTLAEAMKTFSLRYEDKKEVLAYHLGMILNMSMTGQTKSELESMERVTRNSIAGLKLVDGFTGEQMTIACVVNKMRPGLKKEWLQRMSARKEPPDLEMLYSFLRAQAQVVTGLKSMETVVEQDQAGLPQDATPVKRERFQHKSPAYKSKRWDSNPGHSKTVYRNTSERKCAFCEGAHVIHACRDFKAKSLTEKKAAVRTKRLCHNCLGEGHRVAECPSERNCPTCGGRHHSFLHEEREAGSSSINRVIAASEQGLPTTATVVLDAGKMERVARLMVDTGAEVCVVTESLARSLQAPRIPDSNVTLTGMGQVESSYAVKLRLHGDARVGRDDDVLEVRAQVVKEISQPTGSRSVQELVHLPCFKGLPLADAHYATGARIDLLLSHSRWCEARMPGSKSDSEHGVFVDKTMFGWVVASSRFRKGRPPSGKLKVFAVTRTEPRLEKLIEDQWKFEQLPGEESPLSKETLAANSHFFASHTQEEGRHYVGIPPDDRGHELGESRTQAVRRFRSVRRSLMRKSQWKAYYAAMMSFLEEGHAEEVPTEDLLKPPSACYYTPMHAVVKQSSSSTKVRPVCDASACTSTGYSYNDTILVGPSLYQPLQSVTNKFRDTSIGMTADVSKMYRQIGLQLSDRDFHRFVFAKEGEELKDYRMKRLTFGVKSSPFLACKVLEQIGVENEKTHPIASQVIRDHFYMDDVLTGANSVEEARRKREDLNVLLKENAFDLCKWRTNSRELLETIPQQLRETTDLLIGASPSDCQKTLGLHWCTEADELYVSTPKFKAAETVTKRILASVTARIFDPLGWHSPAVMTPRILTQKAWQLPSEWDSELPQGIYKPFQEWVSEMPQLTEHGIPRAFGRKGGDRLYRELHGFADASEVGFGGVVYLRTVYGDGKVTIDVVTSKGRVAPLKPLTIPKLELKGALVTAQLLHITAKDLNVPANQVFAWSDSTVVLGWLTHAPSKLTTFVANRVGQIQALTSVSQWSHVPGETNPADCLSRGVTPEALVQKKLWWEGPTWLKRTKDHWPKRPNDTKLELPELKKQALTVTTQEEELGQGQKEAWRWTRVVAWIKRFVHNCRHVSKRRSHKWLAAEELVEGRVTTWVIAQRFHYSEEYRRLKKGEALQKGHPLAKHNVFVDEHGVIRVGGRLGNADLPQCTIHPVVMPPKSLLTRLLVEETHSRLRHASTAAMIAVLTYSYYIPRLSRIIRSIRSQCLECQRAFARPAGQQMGNLPSVRTDPAEVFARVGVDYAGPVFTKAGRGRSYKEIPTYVALFICMTTRAIHMEVAADASTASFLAALDRFVGRRGLPDEIWCDNGTNFVGASTELKQIVKALDVDESRAQVSNWAGAKQIQWHFSPPKGPNFGGLWEAGVKSMKRLMGKALKSPRLNMDELNTIAVSCEAILNSRPYLPLYSTVEDGIQPLTPGHFLTNRPLCALPQRVQSISKLSRARRWQLVKELQSQLWTRWRAEYVRTLQVRNKQLEPERNLEIGDVVLVHEDGVRRNQWPLARVCEVYPGPDGLVRVVDIQLTRTDPTSKKTRSVRWKRTVRDVTPLPLHVNVNEDEDTGENTRWGGGCSGTESGPEERDIN